MEKYGKKLNDLATVNPKLAREWHPIKNKGLKDKRGNDISTPDKVGVKSKHKVWWILPYDVPMDYPIEQLRGQHFDFEWEATVCGRSNGKGCPYLKGKAVWEGFNDLYTTHPELSKEWHPSKNGNLTPAMITRGYDKKSGGCIHMTFLWTTR